MTRFHLNCAWVFCKWVFAAAALVILVTVIFLTAMRSKAHAQFGGVEQPMFQLTSTATTNIPQPLTLAHQFVYLDLPTNDVSINTWTDRVSGVISTFPQTASRTRPTNFVDGMSFKSATSLSNVPLYSTTNYTLGIIIKPLSAAASVRHIGIWPPYGSALGFNIGINTNFNLTHGAGGGLGINYGAVFSVSEFTDIIWTISATTNAFYTNGVFSESASQANMRFNQYTNTAFGCAPSGSFFNDGFTGFIKEYIVWTNTTFTPTDADQYHTHRLLDFP